MCFNYFVVPSFIGRFNASQYEFDINIYSPIGTVVFEALFIINPNVAVEFLSFDIILEESRTVRESSANRDFLINGTIPPLVIQAPYKSMYWLAITTGYVLDINDTMDITFDLSAFINTTTDIMSMLISNVILHKIGKMLLY